MNSRERRALGRGDRVAAYWYRRDHELRHARLAMLVMSVTKDIPQTLRG